VSALVDFPIRVSHGDDDVTNGAPAVPAVMAVPAGPVTVAQRRSIASLLSQAKCGLREAQCEPEPAQRYATAYLAALRAAAAMLALRGRPHRGRARPASVWVLLTKLAPEMREWAVFFAAGSGTRAAVQAGVTSGVTQRAADDLVRQAAQFADLVDGAVHRCERPSRGRRPVVRAHT